MDEQLSPSLRSSNKPYVSLCGARYVHKGWLNNHHKSCKTCKLLVQEDDLVRIHQRDLSSGRSSTSEGENDVETSTMEANATETCQAEFASNSESRKQLHEQAVGRESGTGEESGSEDSSRSDTTAPTDPDASKNETKAISTYVQVQAADGVILYLEDETYPEGRPPSESRTTNLQLHTRLKAKIEERLTPKDQRGCIYIFSDPKRPHLHKIGRAKNTLARKQQINYSCGLTLQLVGSIEVENYVRVEGLVHIFISDLCRPYECTKCGTKSHGEWFEISEDSAWTHATKWGNFMNTATPYDAISKELHPYVRNLVPNVPKGLDIDVIRSNWEQVLSAGFTDRLRYLVGNVCTVLWKFCWHAHAMLAWTVTFIAVPHSIVFVIMAASVVGTFVAMVNDRDLNRLLYPSTTPKRRRSK